MRFILNQLRYKIQKIRNNRQWGVCFLCLSIVMLIFLPEAIAWRNLDWYLNFFGSLHVLFYLLTVLAIVGLWYGLCNNYGLAWILTFVPAVLLSQINYLKYVNNGKPLFPWDVLIVWEGLKAAGSMADPTKIVILVLCISLGSCLVGLITVSILPKFPNKFRKRVIIFLVSLLVIVGIKTEYRCHILLNSPQKPYQQAIDLRENYHRKGFLMAFLNNIKGIPKISVQDYSRETIGRIVKALPADNVSQKDFQPDIILFVSESYFDMTKLPGIRYSELVNPCFQQLKKQNYVKFYSPAFGGQTANAEFEFLTGFPLVLFSPQIVPYRLYLRRKTSSIASVLSDLAGYKTVMIHPYYRNFWSRNTVVPNLGFDEFIALENMKHTDRRGGFVSDDSLVSEAVDVLEREDVPAFLYLLTIQNHYPFKAGRYDDYDDAVKVSSEKLTEEENAILESYANGVFDSDRALKRLVEYIETSSKRPTLILFLGDHLPSLKGSRIYEKLGYELDRTNVSRYAVDSVVWSNYPIAAESGADYQMCYLPMKILQWAKQPMPAYFRFLEKLAEDYSVLHPSGIYDSHFQCVEPSEFFQSEDAYSLRHLVYDIMFGRAYSQEIEKD